LEKNAIFRGEKMKKEDNLKTFSLLIKTEEIIEKMKELIQNLDYKEYLTLKNTLNIISMKTENLIEYFEEESFIDFYEEGAEYEN
jgi:hypothetical protein